MPSTILPSGYEDSIRTRLGVRSAELPDEAINDRFILNIAETYITKRVPDYLSISSDSDQLYFENAIICYICHLLCPSMPRRVKTQVQTLDVGWKTEKVDWVSLAQEFLDDMENSLTQLTTVTVDSTTAIIIMDIAKRTDA
jgi:hypothetical protein